MKRHDQFLCRLHALICHADKEGTRSIVSFTPDGKKFRIHDPAAFMNSVFPLYFDSLTYSSFEQKLRRWGFVRSPANHQKIDKTTKLENATYGHPCFLRAKIPTLTWIKSDTSIPRTLRPLNNFVYRLRVMYVLIYLLLLPFRPNASGASCMQTCFFSEKLIHVFSFYPLPLSN